MRTAKMGTWAWRGGVAGIAGLLAFVGFSAMGCGSSAQGGNGNQSPGSSAEPLSTFCDALCTRENSCDHTIDKQTCSDSCQNDNASAWPKYRGDIVNDVQNCFGTTDCATILGGNAISTCISTATASIAPTQAGSGFCDSLVTAMGKCGTTLDKASCLNAVKPFNDNAINDANGCTTKACSDIESCVSAAIPISFNGGSGGGGGSGGPPGG